MIPVSGQLERLARATRISGLITVVLGFILAFCFFGVVALRLDAGWTMRNGWGFLAVTAVLIVLYLVPGVLLWWLGRRLDSGRHGTIFPILVVSILHLLPIAISRDFEMLLVGIAVRLPTVYVLAMWLNALPEYRDYRRQMRRKSQRGDNLVRDTTSSQAARTSPPPPRAIPIPRPTLRR